MSSTFQMVAKTFQGLEDVLADELISLGAENVEAGRRMVSFEGDLAMLYKANLCCRTALRILKPIIKFTASSPDELYDCVRDVEWEKYMDLNSTFAIDSTVNSADFPHSKYVTYRVKDGIADHFNDRYGKRPSIRLNGADVQLNVHIFEDRITISLDSSGEPLSKRGYRVAQTAAPINEVLAAGIIMKTGWHGETDFADPMCGSGTFLTEAALIASNINPGIYREHFAFEKWPDFDSELFESMYNDDSEECEPTCRIIGGDIDPEAVAVARKNIRSARLEDVIEISSRSMGEWDEVPDEGVLVMNPPYGERLRPEDMEQLYRNIGKWLKSEFKGWHAWVLGYREEHFDAIHLKPTVKYPILNGALECSLREYVLFDGKYDDFRAEGGSVGRGEDKDIPQNARMRHLSDREWREESRKYDGHDSGVRRKEFRREDRRDDRKRDDRRKDFGRDDRRKDFSRDDRRKDFGRDDRRKDFSRDDRRKDFGRDDRRKEPRKYGSAAPARKFSDRGPKISSDFEQKINTVHMRGRKGWRKNTDGE